MRALLALALAASPAFAGGTCPAGQAALLWQGATGPREARFSVEIADTEAERARGLMLRETLPAGAGMLFVYDKAQPVAFWMKNTLIPLDMLFFDEAGRLVRLHEKAVPGDLTPIPGGEAIRLVLEINGGLAAKLGLAEGAVLRAPEVPQEAAAAPCGP